MPGVVEGERTRAQPSPDRDRHALTLPGNAFGSSGDLGKPAEQSTRADHATRSLRRFHAALRNEPAEARGSAGHAVCKYLTSIHPEGMNSAEAEGR